MDHPNTASSVCRRQSLRRARAGAVVLEPVGLDRQPQLLAPEVHDGVQARLGDLELRGEGEPLEQGEGPQHRLEGVGRSMRRRTARRGGLPVSPCPAGVRTPIAARSAVTAPLRSAESATARASSNASTRAQSRTVRSGGVTPRATHGVGKVGPVREEPLPVLPAEVPLPPHRHPRSLRHRLDLPAVVPRRRSDARASPPLPRRVAAARMPSSRHSGRWRLVPPARPPGRLGCRRRGCTTLSSRQRADPPRKRECLRHLLSDRCAIAAVALHSGCISPRCRSPRDGPSSSPQVHRNWQCPCGGSRGGRSRAARPLD